ncbi:MAG: carboxypeptidase M32 [Acidobacteriota bacterium]|jgi:carboxypeptidase Taq
MSAFNELKERLATIADLDAAAALLGWDQETYMPPGAIEARADQLTTLARLSHDAFTDARVGELLDEAEAEIGDAAYDSDDASLLRVTRRDWERATKLPSDLVARIAAATSRGQQAWQAARAASRFADFAPHLETIVALAREKAEALGYDHHIYDPLLDEYEPGMTTAQLEVVFAELREQLVPIVAALSPAGGAARAQNTPPPLDRRFDGQAQWDFGIAVMEDFGFDFERGRQDRSAHPFTTAFAATDVRVTTRIHEDFLPAGLFGTLHECGHGLYEQGVAAELGRSPLSGGASLGMHESQSRLWEILVGRSKVFWRHYFSLLRKAFGGTLEGTDVDRFYAAINSVCPSLIRVEADEVTYNLHIMLRFELEKDLLEERLAVADLPSAWNDGMETYLGIRPDNDANGVLQDIHWSMGAIGYFPTYTLGNLMSAQIFSRVRSAIPDIELQIAEGDFTDLLTWLQRNIYRHGRKFTANELLARTGAGELSADSWLTYILAKYSDLSGKEL